MNMKNDRIAILLSGYKSGGDTRVVLNLLAGLASKGTKIDLVLASAAKLSLDHLPDTVRVVDLQTPLTPRTARALKLIPALTRYLRREKPKVLISNLIFTNAIVVLAKLLAFAPTKLILVEHLALPKNQSRDDELQSKLIPIMMRVLYPQANAIVSVSQRMADQLQADFKLDNLKVIHNPVVSKSLHQQAVEPLNHPWLQADQPPVFLGVGRFGVQKDFTTLIQAFALLHQEIPARLMILGEGGLRSRLGAEIAALGLEDAIALPGFEPNPYRYMSRATVFVLSSRWEALPTVLIEAMACGAQLVGTNCPYGVDEILSGGEFGQLVPVQDPAALAQAMKQAIAAPIRKELLRARAEDFSIDRAVTQYLALIDSL